MSNFFRFLASFLEKKNSKKLYPEEILDTAGGSSGMRMLVTSGRPSSGMLNY